MVRRNLKTSIRSVLRTGYASAQHCAPFGCDFLAVGETVFLCRQALAGQDALAGRARLSHCGAERVTHPDTKGARLFRSDVTLLTTMQSGQTQRCAVRDGNGVTRRSSSKSSISELRRARWQECVQPSSLLFLVSVGSSLVRRGAGCFQSMGSAARTARARRRHARRMKCACA